MYWYFACAVSRSEAKRKKAEKKTFENGFNVALRVYISLSPFFSEEAVLRGKEIGTVVEWIDGNVEKKAREKKIID